MASLSVKEQQELALSAAYEDDTPTPPGWRRKLIPHVGRGLVPARTDVVFIAPNGEQFKSKTQLQRFLKSKKGSPSLSQFIWITDETPRRSSRSASRHTRSPPRKKKSKSGGVPLQERRVTKRRHTVNIADLEEPEEAHEKHSKETPVESTDDVEESPTWSSAKENKRKSFKGTKERKKTREETQSPEVSSKPYTSEDDTKVEEREKNDEIGEEERGYEMEGVDERNGKEEATEELLSHETVEEDRKTESSQGEEQEAMNSHETMEEEESQKTGKFRDGERHIDNGNNDTHTDDPEDLKEDMATMSSMGSDFSAGGIEAESEGFDSVKKGSLNAEEEEEAIHHAEKETRGSRGEAMDCQENGFVHAVK